MGIIKKIKAFFHSDWCSSCQIEMTENYKQLFMLPMSVGHYVSHQNAEYYKQNLIKVTGKKDIPIGIYACGIKKYRCSKCGQNLVELSIFLPVRDQEKYEETICFKNGELDKFIDNNR